MPAWFTALSCPVGRIRDHDTENR